MANRKGLLQRPQFVFIRYTAARIFIFLFKNTTLHEKVFCFFASYRIL